ncbi:hypothetical protein [Ralstonia pseudosolanacearum]|uniref:hypothetical protein n=1 Tax=Ralstonia pseudosolanacearum TaxID=1310165 RepID=UPI003CEF6125
MKIWTWIQTKLVRVGLLLAGLGCALSKLDASTRLVLLLVGIAVVFLGIWIDFSACVAPKDKPSDAA